MTQEQLDNILAQPEINDIITKLSVVSYTTPKWDDLKKQYEPTEHAILTDKIRYPIIPNDKGGDDMKRIVRGLQKLAVNRMSQAMGVTPVQRTYSFDRDSEKQGIAVDIIEEIYKVQNAIDTENIERFKKNNASCQVATVWFVKEEQSFSKGVESKYTLSHRSYSEMDGYKIYANVDNNGDLLVISFAYKDQDNTEYFDTYIGGSTPQFISYKKSEGWQLNDQIKENPKKLEFLPVIYAHLDEPVWGGDAGTTQVETIEETLSYRAYYIKKNSIPLATIDYGDTTGMTKGSGKETDEDSRRIIPLGKSGKIDYPVWDTNNGTSESQIKELTNAFFDDNQIPNISFSNLLDSRTSADNKDIMLTDSKSKAIDLGGEWERLFNIELNKIIIPFAKIMFPNYSSEFEQISVRSKLRPFSLKSDKENSEFVANAGTSMSLETKVRTLNKVDDVGSEVDKIQEEQNANANNLL